MLTPGIAGLVVLDGNAPAHVFRPAVAPFEVVYVFLAAPHFSYVILGLLWRELPLYMVVLRQINKGLVLVNYYILRRLFSGFSPLNLQITE